MNLNIQNDHAHGVETAGEGAGAGQGAATAEKAKGPDYLTLNDLESYLWKFRRKQGGTGNEPLTSGGGTSSSYQSQSDWASPKKSAGVSSEP